MRAGIMNLLGVMNLCLSIIFSETKEDMQE